MRSSARFPCSGVATRSPWSPRVTRANLVEAPTPRTWRRVVSEHPRKLRLLDWVRYSRGKDRWFFDDGVHVKKKHIGRYAGCIKQALSRYRSAEHPCSPDRR